jgi:hypothetical protein
MTDEKKFAEILARLRKIPISGEMLLKGGMGVALVFLTALMFPRAESVQLEYKIGSIWANKDLIAPFSFPILRDEEEYARDVEEARRRVYEVFERDTAAVSAYATRLHDFFSPSLCVRRPGGAYGFTCPEQARIPPGSDGAPQPWIFP